VSFAVDSEIDTLDLMKKTNGAGARSAPMLRTVPVLIGREDGKKQKIAQGQRNPLKRLIPDEGIQENPSLFL
jgi:hypothetical protein